MAPATGGFCRALRAEWPVHDRSSRPRFVLVERRATHDLDGAELSNRVLLGALRALSWLQDEREHVRRPSITATSAAEELGSVYESLLELHPSSTYHRRVLP